MILLSLCYGKQVGVSEARGKEDSASADGIAGSAFDDEVMLNDVEQLKHLLPYDLGLAEKDCTYHSPLLAYAQLMVFKNMRVRSKDSEDGRPARWGDLNEGYKEKRDDRRAERKERKDSVPPLRRDSFKDLDDRRSRSVSRVSRSVSRVYPAETFLLPDRIHHRSQKDLRRRRRQKHLHCGHVLKQHLH